MRSNSNSRVIDLCSIIEMFVCFFFLSQEFIIKFYRVLMRTGIVVDIDEPRFDVQEINNVRHRLVFEAVFLLNIAHHLVDLKTPFWIEIKVNEETVSVLLTRWIEGGVHLSIMSRLILIFFPFSLFT